MEENNQQNPEIQQAEPQQPQTPQEPQAPQQPQYEQPQYQQPQYQQPQAPQQPPQYQPQQPQQPQYQQYQQYQPQQPQYQQYQQYQPQPQQPQYQQYQQPPQPPQYQQAASSNAILPPKSNKLTMAILVTIFCCWPFGIPAIVNAAMAHGLYAKAASALNDADRKSFYEQYEAKNKAAKTWTTVSLIVGIVFYAIYIAYIVIVGGSLFALADMY